MGDTNEGVVEGQGGDGKTPTVEELLAQLKKRDEEFAGVNSRLDELTQANGRLTSLLEASARRGDPPPTEGQKRKLSRDYAAAYNIPQEAAESLIEEAVQLAEQNMTTKWDQWQALETMRKDFYERNPDLKEHASVVQAFANEIRGKSPDMTMGKALEETAKQAREYIKKIQAKGSAITPGGDPPPIVPGGQSGGSGSGSGPSGKGGDVQLTPEQELDAELKERRERSAKALGGAR